MADFDEAAEVETKDPKPGTSSGGAAEPLDTEPETGDAATKVLERARKRFKIAVDAEDDNRRKEHDDQKFLAATPDDPWQWPDTIYKDRTMVAQEGGPRPCLTINKLQHHHRLITNELKMNRPQIKYLPEDNKSDPKTASALNGVVRNIQSRSQASLAYDMASDAMVAMGEGFFRLYTTYCDERSFDQDIVIGAIPDRFTCYLDPIGLKKHPAGKECRWGFLMEEMPKEEYESLHGKDSPVDWDRAGQGDMAQWFPDKLTVRVAEYFELEDKEDTLCLYQVGEVFYPVLKSEPMPLEVPKGSLPVRERKVMRTQCIWRKLTGQSVIQKRPMPTKYIPICRMFGNQWVVDGKISVHGQTRPAKDAQRMYNYNASLDVELNSLAPRAPFMAADEQIAGYESQYRNSNRVNQAVLKYKLIRNDDGSIAAVQPPQRSIPAMPQAAIIQAKLSANDDIKATTGQFDPSLGNQSNEVSGKAINARKVQSEVGTFHYADNYALALHYAGQIILDMIPKVYDTKRVLRILGEDDSVEHVTLDPNATVPYAEERGADGKLSKIFNPLLGKYDVTVSVGPSFATQREEARAMLVELSQGSTDPAMGAVMRYLTVKQMDWTGAQELADILKKMLPPGLVEQEDGGEQMPAAAMQAIEKMKEGMGQLQGQLEAAGQALAERDKQLADTQAQVKAKNVEALAKMYEADKKALAEITSAHAEVMVARANALNAAIQQPENPQLGELLVELDGMMQQMVAKIAALEESSAAIAQQLQAFEIAARMPEGVAA
jgi:hypothetical protein